MRVALGFYFFSPPPLTVSLVGKYNRPLVTAIPIFLTWDDNFVVAEDTLPAPGRSSSHNGLNLAFCELSVF